MMILWRMSLPALLMLLAAGSPSPSSTRAGPTRVVEVSASVARALATCKCKPSAYVNPGNWVPTQCFPVACLAFSAEVLNTADGTCNWTEVCPGAATNCSGDLKITITSSSSDCCVGQVPGGYEVPAWGAGCTLMGNNRDHTYAGLTKLCGVQEGRNDQTFEVKHCNGSVIAAVTASLICGKCDTGSGG